MGMGTKAGNGNGGGGRTRVGRFELGRTIGEGTFAKVKLARNMETGENVAIKILDKEKILKHKMINQRLLILIHAQHSQLAAADSQPGKHNLLHHS